MSEDSQFDWAGVIFGAMVAVVGFGLAYWAWPHGVMDKPIASLTLRDAVWIIGSIFLALIGLTGVVWAIKDANEPFR